MSDPLTAGWDLGGAHLKLALANSNGELVKVCQVPCPLWLGLDRLDQAIEEIDTDLAGVERHGVTMTGELVDLFADRREGVSALVGRMTEIFPEEKVRIYGGDLGFLTPRCAVEQSDQVASANWLASATLVAKGFDQALFIDLGSTTTDLVPVRDGHVEALGRSDHERLSNEELVYSGITRTPVMAVAREVPFAGQRQAVMAELFATMADVHRVTGRLPEGADQHPTADGTGNSLAESARRLARMLGRDLEDAPLEAWRLLARHLAERQLQSLQRAADRVLSRGIVSDDAPLVGAGIGRFLVRDLADRLTRPYRDFAELVPGPATVKDAAARCAPAAAIALLSLESK